MARSFLFAQDAGDAATTRLIATAAQSTGFMKGEPGLPKPGWYSPGSDNSAFIAELYAAIAATYPQISPALYAVRLWTNLLWQPAYLSVIAVHLHGAVPKLSGLSQQRTGIFVDGYRLVPSPQTRGETGELIADATRQLTAFSEPLLEEINAVVKLRPLPAKRLFADRMLSLMVWLGQRRKDLALETIEQFSAQWLEGLGLKGQGSLEPVEASGHRLLIVKRKGCCLDYLIDPGRYCSTCPKQDETVRIARQAANALAEI